MKLEGSFEVGRTRGEVYRFLTDPARVAAALPDATVSEVRPEGFTVEARVGAGPMRGTMATRLEIVEQQADERAVYAGQAKGLGSVVDLRAGFRLRDDGAGTTVDWSGEAAVGGRLASVAGGLLEPLAKKNIERFVGAVREKLET